MKLVLLLFLSMSALFCAATHGATASTGCPAFDATALYEEIGAVETTSAIDKTGPSTDDVAQDPAHCTMGYPATRASPIVTPAVRREEIRLRSDTMVCGRDRDRVERPPSRHIA